MSNAGGKPASRGRRRIVVSVVSVAVVAGLGAWFLVGHIGDFKKILEIDLRSFVFLSILVTIAIWLSGLTINVIVPIFGTHLTLWEGFGLSAVNTMANFYFTKAGLAAKGVYLKKRHNFGYTSYVSILGGTAVVAMLTQGLVGMASYLVFLRDGHFRIEMLLAFGAITAAGLLPFVLPSLQLRLEHPIFARVQRVADGWQRIRRHHGTILLLLALNVAYIAVGALRLLVSYRAVGYNVDFLRCLVISPLSTLTVLLSVTPGAVGIRQAFVGYGSKLLGIGLTEGVVASTIDHAVGTLWVFFFGFVFSNWVWARRGRRAGETPNQGSADKEDKA